MTTFELQQWVARTEANIGPSPRGRDQGVDRCQFQDRLGQRLLEPGDALQGIGAGALRRTVVCQAGNNGEPNCSRVRVLFSCAWPLDDIGGAPASVRLLAEAFAKAGHFVGVIEMVGPQNSIRKRMHEFGGPVWSLPWAGVPGRHARAWLSTLRRVYQFERVVREFRPDILSVQDPFFQTILVACASVLPHRWRLVVTARGPTRYFGNNWGRRELAPWQRLLLRRADAVTAVSHVLWAQMTREFPFLRDKGKVIQNGIPSSWNNHPDEAGPRPTDRYVLFVGRLHQNKGVDVLLHAWQRVQPVVADTALWLAGEGEERDRLERLARELGMADRVQFLGRTGQRALAALYRHAQLVVIPSRVEGLPRVALEAGLCGAICVAARVGGIPEVIDDGATGFLVEPESPDALVNGIARVLCLPLGDRQRISAAAKRRIEHDFTHERTVKDYERLFHSLLRRERAHPL